MSARRPADDPLLAWLYGRQRFGMAPGLERVRALLTQLGDPQLAFRTVLVGGTNGKGSTVAALAEILACGERVGRFVSPHLHTLEERFVVDGAPLPRGEIDAVLAELRPVAERVGATFFEIVTAAACALFARAGVATAVMEVGIGGRWDSTNALEPALSVITTVGLDHQAVLGPDRATIARDKAGILRPDVPALTGATGAALVEIEGAARRLGAPLWRLGREIEVEGDDLGWRGVRLRVRTPLGAVASESRLIGAHQFGNLALAVAGALRLGAPLEDAAAALPRVRWPGRLEAFSVHGRRVLLDGAHNGEAAEALGRALDALGATPVTLVLGISANKDLAAVAAPLADRAARAVATRAAESRRGAPLEAVAAALRAARPALEIALEPDPAAALRRALRAPAGERLGETAAGTAAETAAETVVVAGSLFLVGEVRGRLTRAPSDGFERDQ